MQQHSLAPGINVVTSALELRRLHRVPCWHHLPTSSFNPALQHGYVLGSSPPARAAG
jgi:hypothetical protein